MKHPPQHKAGDCEVLLRDGRMCATRASITMVREDNSKMVLCTRHANSLREQIAKHVTLYNPVTFSVIR